MISGTAKMENTMRSWAAVLPAGLATEGTMYMSFTGTYIGMFSENAEGHFRNFSVKINKN